MAAVAFEGTLLEWVVRTLKGDGDAVLAQTKMGEALHFYAVSRVRERAFREDVFEEG